MKISLAFIIVCLLLSPTGHTVTAKDGNWIPKFIINLYKLPIMTQQKNNIVFQIGPMTFMTAAHVVTMGGEYVYQGERDYHLCSSSIMKEAWGGLSFEFGRKYDSISKKWTSQKEGIAVMGKNYCSCYHARSGLPKPSPALPEPECKGNSWGDDDWIIFSYYDEESRRSMLASDLTAWLNEWYVEGIPDHPAPESPLVPEFYQNQKKKTYFSLDFNPLMKDEEILYIGSTPYQFSQNILSTHPHWYDVYSAGLMQVEEVGRYGANLKSREHLGWVITNSGDSGGPWFRIFDDGSIRVVGVHSSGDKEKSASIAIFSSSENQAIINNFIKDSGAEICGVNVECEPNFLPIDSKLLYAN